MGPRAEELGFLLQRMPARAGGNFTPFAELKAIGTGEPLAELGKKPALGLYPELGEQDPAPFPVHRHSPGEHTGLGFLRWGQWGPCVPPAWGQPAGGGN